MEIRTLLEREGIVWAKRMDCPRCGSRQDITANERIGYARCWQCLAEWNVNSQNARELGNWQTSLLHSIAERCRAYLPNSEPCLKWLMEKRKLPKDVRWLQAHYLGAVPGKFSVSTLVSTAKQQLDQDRDSRLLTASKPAQKKTVEENYELQLHRLYELQPTLDMLNETKWKDAVVYLYINDGHELTSLNIRNFLAEENDLEKVRMRLQPDLGKRGVFCPIPVPGEAWSDLPTIIVEGEHNWLSLCRVAAEWNRDNRYALAGFAMGGKTGADISVARKLLEGEKPVVLYDNDAISLETGRPGGYDLVESFLARMSVRVATTSTKDADDWVIKEAVTPNQLRALVAPAKLVPQPTDKIADAIDELRSDQDLKDRNDKKVGQATGLVWMSILDSCLVFNVGGGTKRGQGILLLEEESGRRLIEISPDHPTWDKFMLNYGLEPSDKMTKDLSKNIWLRTLDKTSIRPCLMTHYELGTGRFYLDLGSGKVMVIHPDGSITEQSNGDDNVVFYEHAVHPPATLDLSVAGVGLRRKGGWFEKLISGTVEWDTEAGLSEERQKLLLRGHFFQVGLDTLIHGKMCPILQGTKGSGKNTITERIGRFWEGPAFSIQLMPDDPKSLNEKTVNRIYAGFDEFDSKDLKMESAFRSWCTTLFYETRELYTTMGKAIYPLARGASLSTNWNPTMQAATTRRQLPLFVRSRGDKGYRSPAADLWPEFDRDVHYLWEEVIADFRVIVRELAEVEPFPVRHTMSDFFGLLCRCARAEGWEEEANNIQDDLAALQDQEVEARAFWPNQVNTWLGVCPEQIAKPMTAAELCDFLRTSANDPETRNKLNPYKFGEYCKPAREGGYETMVRRCGMKMGKKDGLPDKHNATQYSFNPPNLPQLEEEDGF